MRPIILFILLVGIGLKSFGQERFIKRAYDAIQKENWSLAESNLGSYESKEGKKPELYFLRHQILVRTATNPAAFDTAKQLLELAVAGFNTLSVKNQEEWCKDIDFCKEQIPVLLLKVDSLVFESVKKTNSLSDINWYLNRYPNNTNTIKAKNWKIHLLFLEAKAAYTEEAFSTFISTYPEHEDAPMAKQLMWKIGWEKTIQENTIKGYQSFLSKYPQASQREQATAKIEELAWKEAEKIDSEEGYLAFIKNYPKSPQSLIGLRKAEELGWIRANQNPSTQGFLSYANKYPESKHRISALKKGEEIAWKDAKNSSDDRKMKQFIETFPKSDSIELAKAFLEERVVNVLPWLTQDRKYRLYNTDKREFVNEIEYDFISPAAPNRFIVCRDQKKGIIDKEGKAILPSNYDEISQIGPGLYQVTLNMKRGVMNNQAEIVIPFKYDQITRTPKGHYIVGNTIKDQAVLGILNAAGSQLVAPKYSQLTFSHDSLFVAGNQQLFGVIGERGSVIIPLRYESIEKGIDKQWKVREKNKWGVIRQNGSYAIKPMYDYFENYTVNQPDDQHGEEKYKFYLANLPNNRAVLLDSSGTTILSHTGSITALGSAYFKIAPPYSADNNTESVRIFNAASKSYVTQRQFQAVGEWGEDKFWVSESGRSGYIDINGKSVTPFIFSDDAQIINPQEYADEDLGDGDDFYYTEVDEPETKNCGLYNSEWSENNSDTNPWRMSPGVFSNGFAAVNIEGKIGYIDATGKIRIQPKYNQATPFWRGVAEVVLVVKKGEEEEWVHQLIDTTGSIIADNRQVVAFSDDKGLVILTNDKTGEEARYELFDISTKQKQLIGNEFNYLFIYTGYLKGTIKDVEVYVSYDGKVMMDNTIDFRYYNASLLTYEASSHIYSEKWDEAIQKCKEALQLRPRYIRAMMMLVHCYKSKQYHSEVVSWYNKAQSTAPGDMQIVEERMRYYYDKKYWSEAIRDIDMLILNKPDYNYWFEKAYAESELNYHDRAIASYTKYLEKNKNNSVALNNRGIAYLNKGMYAQAVSDFSNGIRHATGTDKEEMGRLYNNRGITLVRMKRESEACSDFQKSSSYGYTYANQNIRNYCQRK